MHFPALCTDKAEQDGPGKRAVSGAFSGADKETRMCVQCFLRQRPRGDLGRGQGQGAEEEEPIPGEAPAPQEPQRVSCSLSWKPRGWASHFCICQGMRAPSASPKVHGDQGRVGRWSTSGSDPALGAHGALDELAAGAGGWGTGGHRTLRSGRPLLHWTAGRELAQANGRDVGGAKAKVGGYPVALLCSLPVSAGDGIRALWKPRDGRARG